MQGSPTRHDAGPARPVRNGGPSPAATTRTEPDVGRPDDGPGSVALVYRDCEPTDGIGCYCQLLEDALSQAGVSARIVRWNGHGIEVSDGVAILQYNPFSFGRWGFAPRLVRDVLRLARRHPQTRRALMVHEPFVPISTARSLVMGVWQRLQLLALVSLADVVMVSTASWNPRLPARARPIAAPVGSNLPDARKRRAAQRDAIGAAPGTIVLASFGTGHPARLIGHVVAAANAVAAASERAILLVLGTGNQPLDGLDSGVTVRRPGPQSPVELAAELSAADIYLAAFVDGLSTRRTSLMAGLQHGLAVVGTDGPLTEPELRREEAAISWVPAADRRAFARAAVALAGEPATRSQRGLAARHLYERRFAWERIAQIMVAAIAETPK
jgi:glycosyltransferase involved in cell wall biosynthesis